MIPRCKVWLKEENKMYSPSSIDFEYGGVLVKESGNISLKKFSEVNLLWSTGLKDKHKNNIFEGDIIKAQNKLFTVHWKRATGSWAYKPVRKNPPFKPFAPNECVIVGNVYEYPGLLRLKR